MEQRNNDQRGPSTKVPGEKRRGCFFYGCLISLVVIAFLGLAIFWGVRWVTQKVVHNFTSKTPLILPLSNVDPTETAKLLRRYDDFKSAFESGKEGASLVLSSVELNSLIAVHPDFERIKDNISVDLGSNHINIKINFPLDDYGYKGRFLTGEATSTLERPGGVLIVELKKLRIGDIQVPASFLSKQKNLISKLYEDPDITRLLARFKTIELENGMLKLGT
ncbi:MAG: hypothetical protein GYA55_03405 [SAR324 cluster bacterium]|uniref:Uncharacterized protein n=1 Tax=SAR324 cluster bacterium TaxID=2024889 RepID=A0A7X9FQ13_9DELT|nr:hypothetical protein [SAR324 cluster bacterium]